MKGWFLKMSHKKCERQTVFCKSCGFEIKQNPNETISTHNKRVYCSYSCQIKKVIKKCKMCSCEYKVHNFRKDKSSFCSDKCKGNYYSFHNVGENSSRWLGGKSFEDYDIKFNQKLRNEIRKRDNFTCCICGLVSIKPALDVHHIDYNKKNSSKENLISLCHSCHAKIKNGDEERRKYLENIVKR